MTVMQEGITYLDNQDTILKAENILHELRLLEKYSPRMNPINVTKFMLRS